MIVRSLAEKASEMASLEIANVRRPSFDVSGLEYGFHDLNQRRLWLVFALFGISLAYFAYCTEWQNVDALLNGV